MRPYFISVSKDIQYLNVPLIFIWLVSSLQSCTSQLCEKKQMTDRKSVVCLKLLYLSFLQAVTSFIMALSGAMLRASLPKMF